MATATLNQSINTMTTAHPSRTAPACVTCTFAHQGQLGVLYCNHPTVPVDPVSGTPKVRAQHCRLDVSAKQLGYTPCGAAGVLFAPRVGDLLQPGVQHTGNVGSHVTQAASHGCCCARANELAHQYRVRVSKPLTKEFVDVSDGGLHPAGNGA